MVNCIGGFPPLAQVLSLGAHAHDYAKAPRPGRKVGHLTLRADTREDLQERLSPVLALVAQTSA